MFEMNSPPVDVVDALAERLEGAEQTQAQAVAELAGTYRPRLVVCSGKCEAGAVRGRRQPAHARGRGNERWAL